MLQDVYLCEHLKRWWIFCLHHLVSVFCYATMVHYGENLFLGAFGIFMEGNTFCFDILWIFKYCEIEIHHRCYISFAKTALGLSLILRFLIPVIATIYACVAQSPLSMHPVPLAALFLAGVFFTAINVWVTYLSYCKIKKCLEAQKLEKLESIVTSKVPDFINMPRQSQTKRNILPTSCPLADISSQRNCASGATYFNNLTDLDKKTDKTSFNMGLLMQYQGENELNQDLVQRRQKYLWRGAHSHSRTDRSSSSSSDTFICDAGNHGNRVTSEAQISAASLVEHYHYSAAEHGDEKFEDIPLSPV